MENPMGKIDDLEVPFKETSKSSKTESDPVTGSFEPILLIIWFQHVSGNMNNLMKHGMEHEKYLESH